MPDNTQNNKRIAKNTAFLYLRMLFVMSIALYTTRVIFKALGAENMGIYNVVGGLTISFAFFSSSLSNATQRFLNIEFGKNNNNGANQVFCLSTIIYIVIIIAVLLLGTIIGTWFIENKMTIPTARIDAAIFVLYTTLAGLAITLFSSVYDSMLIAKENMKVYAYISVLEVILKLIVAYMVNFITCDKLKLYALLFLIAHCLVKTSTIIYCINKYPECKFKFYWNIKKLKEMFSFIGWNGFATAVWMINDQGTNILLNIFFGPLVNASRAISSQVSGAINNFSNNFYVAVRPQIIKSYASQNYEYLKKLIYSSSKFSFFLMWLLSLPIITQSDYILTLWLNDVPKYAVEFVQWVLIYNCIGILTNPIWTAVQATGYLKKYTTIGSIVFLMAFPLSYIFLKAGSGPIIVFQMLVIFRAIYHFVCFKIAQEYIDLSLKEYFQKTLLPILKVIFATSICVYIGTFFTNNSLIVFISMTLLCIITTITAVSILGLSQSERKTIIRFIKNKIGK